MLGTCIDLTGQVAAVWNAIPHAVMCQPMVFDVVGTDAQWPLLYRTMMHSSVLYRAGTTHARAMPRRDIEQNQTSQDVEACFQGRRSM